MTCVRGQQNQALPRSRGILHGSLGYAAQIEVLPTSRFFIVNTVIFNDAKLSQVAPALRPPVMVKS
jgi:hypothetical protein